MVVGEGPMAPLNTTTINNLLLRWTSPNPTATSTHGLYKYSSRTICFKAGDVISLTLTMSETLKLNNTTGSKVAGCRQRL
ncbi:MAG: hypothetical protein H0A76_10060 [Candidatus Thiodubiliella endoseptemdiera]|uniref:Uncharacterized protein n=1 Tax=Candidatus Thiodubiliella endoseptemdiera TaxID=2738886 RepID=A0A853F7P3_9GAMM|nr:hypothetical protein [Candidatus Thiodubiliella endoseptemdiera]